MTYGRWLRAERRRRDIKQKDIENATGISESHVSRIERGGISMPEQATRQRIHDVLGTSDDDLVAAGLLTRSVIPNPDGTSRTIYFTPDGRSEEGFVRWNVTTVATPEPDAADVDPVPPHLRASFLKMGELSPEKQRELQGIIDTYHQADQDYIEQMRRDRERRIADGLEE